MTEQERLQWHAIDINGLNPCDRDRIEEIGFDRWLDEVADEPPTCVNHAGAVSRPRKSRRKTRRNCVRCGNSFLAKRADAKYCSLKCRVRACRYPTETDNYLATPGTHMNTGANEGTFHVIAAQVL
jgi:hypothetical protein